MIVRIGSRLAGAVIVLGGVLGVGLTAAPAWGAALTGHNAESVADFGYSGIPGAFNLNAGFGMAPFDPSKVGCPFDSTVAFVMVGNGVEHMTWNKNGFWGGGTATGPTTLETSDGTPLYVGQATVWSGGGTNIAPGEQVGQFEIGETFHFHGTASDPKSSWPKLDVTLDYHLTVNNNGTPTNMSEDLTCR